MNFFDLSRFAPHPRLVRYWSDTGSFTPPPGLGSSRKFMRGEVKKAADHVPRSKKPFQTLVVGPAGFSDVPLEHLLGRGAVVGVDVNLQAMKKTRRSLKPKEQERLVCIQSDASLFATPALNAIEAEIEKRTLGNALFAAAYNTVGSAVTGLRNMRYPFPEGEFDLIVAMSTLTQLTMTFASILDDLFAENFGTLRAGSFFDADSPSRGTSRRDLMNSLLSELYKRVFMKQLREFARMLKTGGAVFISDHVLRTECLALAGRAAEIDLNRAEPNSILQEGFNLSCSVNDPLLRVRVREREERIALHQDRSFARKARKAGLQVLDHFFYWNLVDLSESEIYELSLDEAVVATKS